MRLPEFAAENSLGRISEDYSGLHADVLRTGTGSDAAELIYPAALCHVCTEDGCVTWNCYRGRNLM